MKTWSRFLFFRLLTTFVIITLSLFTLFALLDYATHMRDLAIPHIPNFYLHQFSKFSIYLLPLALLLTTIKTLTNLSAHFEITAFKAAGISAKKLSLPLLTFSLLITGMIYLIPKSQSPQTQNTKKHLTVHTMEDGGKLYYQKQYPDHLFDVLWMPNPDEIYRIKTLTQTHAHAVHHLKRIDQKFTLIATHESMPLQIPLTRSPPPIDPLLPLYTLAIPLMLYPLCTRHTRNPKTFLLYAFSLFAFITFHALIGATHTLATTSLITPTLATLIPVTLALTFSGGYYLCK